MKNMPSIKNPVLLLLLVVIFSGCNLFRKTEKTQDVKLKTDTDKFSYALGLSMGENLKSSGLDSINIQALARGLEDQMKGRDLLMSPEEAGFIVQKYLIDLEDRKTESNKEAEREFLDKNRKRPGVKELESGLQYEVIKEGSGPQPTIADNVTVHYHGTLSDGTVFDSSIERDEPMSFPIASVIPGMQEALLLMNVGSKWRVYIPSKLAYGETGAGGVIEPFQALVFDVELLGIE
jgi:FKBP-type peptidyl-prolyl cis-trans isomerase FklB